MRLDIELLQGACDTHAHSLPALFPRPFDHIEVAKNARDAGLKAVVLKCHHEGTAGRAYLVRRMVSGVEVFGGIVLNRSVGGLNPFAVSAAIGWGAKIVWMPTVDALNHLRYYDELGQYGDKFKLVAGKPGGYEAEAGISLPTEGDLPTDLENILHQIADADIALGTGHLSPPEIKNLVGRARKMGVKKIIVTHPAFSIPNLSVEEMEELAGMGAYMEFVYATLSPAWHANTIENVADYIKRVGSEHCIIASDCGQIHNPSHPEGIRIYIRMLLEKGFSEREIETMVSRNPSKILGL